MDMINCSSYFICAWRGTPKCEWCARNEDLPVRADNYAAYRSTCPLGEECSSDPANIQIHYPGWYKEHYGDADPQDIVKQHCGMICPKFTAKK